mmetsp:Transcript_4632/g.7730  ORF Transcript_4632/g.7730 Transcript_4632/m.7730 type:complete len:264 (-) Transcript_4632:688-1479(-)
MLGFGRRRNVEFSYFVPTTITASISSFVVVTSCSLFKDHYWELKLGSQGHNRTIVRGMDLWSTAIVDDRFTQRMPFPLLVQFKDLHLVIIRDDEQSHPIAAKLRDCIGVKRRLTQSLTEANQFTSLATTIQLFAMDFDGHIITIVIRILRHKGNGRSIGRCGNIDDSTIETTLCQDSMAGPPFDSSRIVGIQINLVEQQESSTDNIRSILRLGVRIDTQHQSRSISREKHVHNTEPLIIRFRSRDCIVIAIAALNKRFQERFG